MRLGLALALAVLSGCASQQEAELSALHYFQKGNAAFAAEAYDRAARHYREALAYDDQAPDVHYNLGLAYYRAQAYDEAVAAYADALRLDPQFADAHLNLALAYDRLYRAAEAHSHYSRYRALVAARESGTERRAPPQATARPATARPATATGGSAAPASKAPPNPFQGNDKWWTQDPASRTQ